MNTIRLILIALIVVISAVEFYSLYDYEQSNKNTQQLNTYLHLHKSQSSEVMRWALASRELLKESIVDRVVNEWVNVDQRLQNLLAKEVNKPIQNQLEANAFAIFKENVLPSMRSRVRTSATDIPDSEAARLLEAESRLITEYEKLQTAIDEQLDGLATTNKSVLYAAFSAQLLLVGVFVFLSARKSEDENVLGAEVDEELENRVSIQNKAIEELKGMIEKNVKTINLKDKEITDTKKSLGEAQEKVEEYTRELRKVAKNLSKAQNEVKNFSQMIARDLRGPLKTISQLSSEIQQALLENEDVDQATKEKIRELLARVSDMEDIISGILEYASVGQKEVLQKVNTKEMVDELVRFFEPDPETKIVIHDDLPTIRTDNLALKQVFYNLISNAVKFSTGQGSKVEIGCVEGPVYYKFWVSDNGPGIPKADQERIFELFEKVEGATTKKSSGVGLALVKKILSDKGLDIWVKSEEGEGSKFTFTWKKNMG